MIYRWIDFALFLMNWSILYLAFAAAAAGFYRLCRALDPDVWSRGVHGVISVTCGPLLLSWAFVYLLAVLPGFDRSVYLTLLALALVPCLLWLRPPGRGGLSTGVIHVIGHPYRAVILAVTVFGLAVLYFLLVFFPLLSNDPLEYMQAGRVMEQARSSRGYPFVDPAVTGGFLAPWTHPPSYPGLIALAFMIQGDATIAGIAKLITPWFVVATLPSTAALAGSRRWSAGVLAALLLLGTPLYFDLAVIAHVDAIRIAGLVAAVLAATFAARQGTRGATVVAGLATGLAMFTHSTGAIMLPLVLLVFACVSLLRGRAVASVLGSMGLIAVLAVGLVLPQLIANYLAFGSLLQDSVKVSGLPNIHMTDYLQATRFLFTLWDKLVFGALAPLTAPRAFGFAGVLALIGFLVWLRRAYRALRSNRWSLRAAMAGGEAALVPILVVAAFLGLAVLSVLAGSLLFIKNQRYLITIQPFVALVAANFLIGLVYLARAAKPGRWLRLRERGTSGVRDRFRNIRHKLGTARESRPKGLAGRLLRAIANAASWSRKMLATPMFWASLPVVGLCLASLSHFNVVLVRDAYLTNRLSPATLLDAEAAKRNAIRWPQVELESRIREVVPPGDIILAYRQAELGFYTGHKFMAYFDDRLLPVHAASDAAKAPELLWGLGVRWIYVPGYALPEIYNSAVEGLLSDPRVASLVFDRGGWRLFRLLQAPPQVAASTVASADYVINPGLSLTWHQLRPISLFSTLFREQPGSSVVKEGPIEVAREDALFTRPQLWRTLTDKDWPDVDVDTSFLTGIGDFPARSGRYRFEAEVDGSGLSEAFVRLDFRTDLKLASEIVPLWTGVLSQGRRTISGVFLIQDDYSSLQPKSYQDRLAQIYFRVHQRAGLRLLRWRVERIAGGDPLGPMEPMVVTALDQGWRLEGDGRLISPTLSGDAGQKDWTDAVRTGKSIVPTAFKRTSSRAGTLIAPILVPPVDQGNATDKLPFDRLVYNELVVTAHTTLQGSALVDVGMMVTCKGSEQSAQIALGRVFVTARPLQHQFRMRPPCLPTALRLTYTPTGLAHRNNDHGSNIRLTVLGVGAAIGATTATGSIANVAFVPLH